MTLLAIVVGCWLIYVIVRSALAFLGVPQIDAAALGAVNALLLPLLVLLWVISMRPDG